MKTIGERIRTRRLELNMTQKELADRVGYSNKSTIGKIENGNNDITQSKVVEFSKALDTTVAYLMGWEENNELMGIAKDAAYLKDLHDLIFQMTDGQKQQLYSYARFLLSDNTDKSTT